MTGETTVDALRVRVLPDSRALGEAAARHAATVVGRAIEARGVAHVMFATGNSQLDFLDVLVLDDAVDWSRVVGFHMDEYVGICRRPSRELPALHARAASSRGCRSRCSTIIDGDADRHGGRVRAVRRAPPRAPARPLLPRHRRERAPRVQRPARRRLRRPARREGGRARRGLPSAAGRRRALPDVDDVPTHAITVTIPALLRASTVLAIVPEARKAEPVRRRARRTDRHHLPGVGPAHPTERHPLSRRRVRRARGLTEPGRGYFFDGTDGRFPVR